MFSQNSIGIDFRKDSVTLVHLRASIGGIRFVNRCNWPLNPLEGVEQQLKDAEKHISLYLSDQKIDSPEIYVSIPADAAMQRILEMPFAVRENLHGTLRYELEKYFPLSPEEVYLDAQIISENKATNKIKILLMAVKKEVFTPFISLSRDLASGVCSIETSITAIANYLYYFSETAKKKPSIFICRQGDAVEVGLIKDGKLHYGRVVAAEPIEVTPLDIFQTELPMVAPLLNPDEKHLYIYTDGFDEKEGFDKAKKEINGFTITKLEFPISVQSERPLFTAYGLALKGFKQLPAKINLLPKAVRKRPAVGTYYVMVALIILIVIAGLVSIGGHVLKKQAALNRLDDRLETLKKDNAKVTEVEEEIVFLEKRLKQLNSIRQEYVPVIEILKELTHRMPNTAYIRDLLLSSSGFQIVGSAESATEIVTLLSESDLFKNVVFLSAITKDKDGKEQFRIGFTVARGGTKEG